MAQHMNSFIWKSYDFSGDTAELLDLFKEEPHLFFLDSSQCWCQARINFMHLVLQTIRNFAQWPHHDADQYRQNHHRQPPLRHHHRNDIEQEVECLAYPAQPEPQAGIHQAFKF